MATVSVVSTDTRFTVSKIICIGRNYAGHAKEMRADIPTDPVFFLKPPTAVIGDGALIRIPSISHDLHHEVEMTVLIGKGGSDIPEADARDHVAGYGIGLDMTLRDIQAGAKAKGLPWTLAKGFDTSAPVSPFVPSAEIADPSALRVSLHVNGERRQEGKLSDLIFPVEKLVAYISRFISLEKGDIIFTGTPEGVGAVVSGDSLQAALLGPGDDTLVSLSVAVA